MKKIKRQFLVFFLVLAATLGFLLVYSYNQINKEEQRLWEGIAENTFNQMQANISDLLLKEDSRSFSEYRYYYVPETLKTGYALNISPLADPPQHDPMGLLGYFQINPDGSFNTPYVPPKKDQEKLTDFAQRKRLQDSLNQITTTLQNDIVTNLTRGQKEKKNPHTANIIELGKLAMPRTSKGINTASIQPAASPGLGGTDVNTANVSKLGSGLARSKKSNIKRKSLYPNPLKKTAAPKYKYKDDEGTEEPIKAMADTLFDTGDDGASDFKQEVQSNVAQFQTFQEQKIAYEKDLDEPAEEESFKEEAPKNPSVMTDPFRARLVDFKNIVFYRKLWLDQKIYIQGFVIELDRFFQWLMGLSFENSNLPSFAEASLNWEDKVLSSTGIPSSSPRTLFQRKLGYPLNQFALKIRYNKLPQSTSRYLLYLLTLLLALIATFGLFIIYRSALKEVLFAEKRQDFVSAVTHELKTPLTSIRMYSEMLSSGWVENEEKKQEYYNLMTREGDRLSRLIDNVLHLARLEKHNYRFNLTTSSPDGDFEALSRELKDLVEPRGFAWQTLAAPDLPQIVYDPEAVKQILIVLIDNSIKFSNDAKEKKIEMNLKKEGNKVVWSIADRGPGVPCREMSKIFDKFYRVENEMTRKTKGTGIGLAMAKMLMDGMGGSLEAKNREHGGLAINLVFETVRSHQQG